MKKKEDTLLAKCQMGERNKEKVYVPPIAVPGCQCADCGDSGYREYWQDGYRYMEECHCLKHRKIQQAIIKAGINLEFTFENFNSSKNYQQKMLETALSYVEAGYHKGNWFFIGGQVGSGKTHICSAILNILIGYNYECQYMMWRNESIELKALVNQYEEYRRRIDVLCKVQVLYIDDLWKTQAGKPPTDADIKLAFQIINMRAQNAKLLTIISSELPLTKIIEFDEATGSRIFSRCGDYKVFNDYERFNNYRIFGKS